MLGHKKTKSFSTEKRIRKGFLISRNVFLTGPFSTLFTRLHLTLLFSAFLLLCRHKYVYEQKRFTRFQCRIINISWRSFLPAFFHFYFS